MKKFLVVLFCAALMVAPAVAMTKEEEDAAWRKEPAYGRVLQIGYNGGLCLGAFGIAQLKGFYEAEGLKTEVIRMAGGSSGQIDAIGTGKVDVTGDHIATMLVPTVNGVRVKFTTGIHSGCKSLYVPVDSPIWSANTSPFPTVSAVPIRTFPCAFSTTTRSIRARSNGKSPKPASP